MFNPSSYLAKKGIRNLKNILKNCDILVLNKEEAEILLNRKTDDIKNLIKSLKKTIPGIAVITDGRKGVYVLDTENNYYHGFTKKINIKETTGAGDAFVSGFGTGIIMEKSIKDCIKMGLCNSESVIQYYGAQNGLLTRKQMITKLKKDRRKIVSSTI
jgi:sugar/nucleoside kinase (ribokinase family)